MEYIELKNESTSGSALTLIDLISIEIAIDLGNDPKTMNFAEYRARAIYRLMNSDCIEIQDNQGAPIEDRIIANFGRFAIGYRVVKTLGIIKVYYDANKVADNMIELMRGDLL